MGAPGVARFAKSGTGFTLGKRASVDVVCSCYFDMLGRHAQATTGQGLTEPPHGKQYYHKWEIRKNFARAAGRFPEVGAMGPFPGFESIATRRLGFCVVIQDCFVSNELTHTYIWEIAMAADRKS